VELSLTELLQRADQEIGRAAGMQIVRLRARRAAWPRQKPATANCWPAGSVGGRPGPAAVTHLQGVERIASVLVLPHPERDAPDVRRLKPNPRTEATAMSVVMDHERALGRQAYDVHESNLGYDITSLDVASGELRLIEVKASVPQQAQCC